MSMSGVKMNEDCIDAYLKVKNDKAKCCIFRISDDNKNIQVEEESLAKFTKTPTPEQFENFVKLLPEHQCRYAIYHAIIGIKGQDGIKGFRDRIVFVSWAPDTAKVKAKMLHSSSKAEIKKQFESAGIEFQFSCLEELNATEWVDKFNAVPNIKLSGDVTDFEGLSYKEWEER